MQGYANHSPSLADFEEMADKAFRQIPETFREKAKDVTIRVENLPSPDVVREMELESPYDLLGLYSGVALPFKSSLDPGGHQDMVFLYREPMLAYWRAEGGILQDIVTHVLVHELGHHFGFSDDDMHWIEEQD
jgi:predicted Zn-dependent protease with MMP-like domain